MFRQKIILIAAVSPEGILAIDSQMPWYQPEDLRRFKRLTTGNVLIYGRKTFESFNKNPLPGRQNLIVSKSYYFNQSLEEYKALVTGNNYVRVHKNIEDAIEEGRFFHPNKTIYIGGGASIYEQTLPIVDEIELTIINKDQVCYYEGERILFPKWRNAEFKKDFKLECVVKSKTCKYVTYKKRPISISNKVRSFFV